MDNKNEEIRLSKSFDELLDLQYGMIEAKKRNKFEEKVLYFVENEVLKKTQYTGEITVDIFLA